MKSELSFLVSLLLEHKLTVATKKAVQARIVEVEQSMQQPNNGNYSNQPRQATANNTFTYPPQSGPQSQVANQQSPSTIALLEKHGMLPPASVGPVGVPVQMAQPLQPPEQPTVTVVNPAAVSSALAEREAFIARAQSGKGTSAPKFRGQLKG